MAQVTAHVKALRLLQVSVMEYVRALPTEWAKDIPIAPGVPVEFVPVAATTAVIVFVANIVLVAFGYSANASSRILSQINASVLSALVLACFFPQFGGTFPQPSVAVAEDMGMWPPSQEAWANAWLIPSITSGFFVGDFVICVMFKELWDLPTFVHHSTWRIAEIAYHPHATGRADVSKGSCCRVRSP